MKRTKYTLMAGGVLLTSALSFGQMLSVSTFTDTYADLTGATVLNTDVWDDPDFTVPIGFDFPFYEDTVNQFFISSYGLGAYITTTEDLTDTTYAGVWYGPDLMDRGYDAGNSLSPISYITTGTAGNRIFKLEYKNAGFYGDIDDDGISTDFVNLQIWLYEVDHVMEIRFGSSNVTQPSLDYDGADGPSFIFVPNYDFNTSMPIGQFQFLNGDANNPTMNTETSVALVSNVSGTPQDGRVYRFAPASTAGLNSASVPTFKLYPNPASDVLYVDYPGKVNSIELLDATGKVISTSNVFTGEVSLAELTAGVYFITLYTEDGQKTMSRFVKK